MIEVFESLKAGQVNHNIPMSRFYDFIGISKQGFYKAKKRFDAYQLMVEQIKPMVLAYRRKKDARAGSRSLYYNLDIKNRFDIGVSKFEQILSVNNITLPQLKIRIVTTNSVKQSWNYTNLINGISITSINNLIVGDLTYLMVLGKRYYLFCLTDVYSSRIVGHHVDKRMRTEEALCAYKMWIKLRGNNAVKGCIHHTDGGSQYFSTDYLSAMNDSKLQISRAENCLENGYAEQRNGLIKNHLIPLIANRKVNITNELGRLISIYNNERKQEALGWLSPVEYENKCFKNMTSERKKMYNFNKV